MGGGWGRVMGRGGLGGVGQEPEAARGVLAALAEETADLSGARAAHIVVERAFSAENPEADARAGVDRLAHLAAAAALGQSAGHEIANLFARSRLENPHAPIYGTSEIPPEEARPLTDRPLSPPPPHRPPPPPS